MKAAVYYGVKDIRLEEMDAPKLKAGEILVKMRACGVCTTDIKTILRGHPLIKPPTVLGHEVAGVVVKAQTNVSKFQQGERVVIAPYVPCGMCYFCRHKQYTLCENLFRESISPGGFAELIRVPASIVEKGTIRIPSEIAYEEAVFTEPLACCLHGMEKCNIGPSDYVVVIGDGPMGLLFLQLAKLTGARVIVSGHHESRLKVAVELGADETVNGKIEDSISKVMELTEKRGADIVIVAAGTPSATEQAIKIVRKGGIVNLFAGLPSEYRFKFNLNIIHYSELVITGAFGFSHIHFSKAFQLIGERKINVRRLITHKFSLDKVLDAVKLSISRGCLKTVIVT